MKKYIWFLVLPFIVECASVSQRSSGGPAGGSTCIQDWFSKGTAFYCANNGGRWYLLGEPVDTVPATAYELYVAKPKEMDVLLEIPLGKGRPVGFAINHRGEFITAQGGKIHVYGNNGAPLLAFNASVQDARLNSPLATDAQDRIYSAKIHELEIFSREGNALKTVPFHDLLLSVAVGPDQSIWCVTDANQSCHLIHLSPYPGCAVIADYDRESHPIRGIPAKYSSYTNWREVAATSEHVALTHGTGKDSDQGIFVLSTDGATMVNQITDLRSKEHATMVNAHGLAASGDTLMYLDYDAAMRKWMNRVTIFDAAGMAQR